MKGHAGDPGNEAADNLSKMATDRQNELQPEMLKKRREKHVHRKIWQQKRAGHR